jgi:NAD(P)-dependent dehydrogenase (short-subunit alcohol dehydrogenase family)
MAVAVVTGAASGIGAAIRTRLEKDGFQVIGVDLRDAEIVADLSAPEGRRSAVAGVLERCGGRLDRLVACAGLGPHVRPPSLVASVNYFGAVDVIDGLCEALSRGVDPAVVVVVSNSAQMAPLDDHPFVAALLDGDEAEAGRIIDELDNPVVAYMGSKHALGRALRRRVRRFGEARVADPATRDAIESIDLPIGRWGQPEDVAELVAFLLAPAAGWIHGSIVFIDGGNDAEIRPERY